MKLTNCYQTIFKKNKGFTLLELIVVIALLAVLMLILVPTMSGFVERAKMQSLITNAETVYRATTAVKLQWEIEGKDPFSNQNEFNNSVLEMVGISKSSNGKNVIHLTLCYNDDYELVAIVYYESDSNSTIYKKVGESWTTEYKQFSYSNVIDIINISLTSSE